jgi:hypothetical protein
MMSTSATSFGDALDRYLTALRSVGSAFPDQVRPQPENERLLQSLRDQGMSLPGEMVEWFAWFGSLETPEASTKDWFKIAPALRCLTLNRAIELNQWWSGEMGYDRFAPDWLSIADYIHGDSIVVNCSPEFGTGIEATTTCLSNTAQLEPRSQWLPNLVTLLSWWTQRIETGGWTYDAEEGWRNHVRPPSDADRYATGLMG